MLRAARQAGCRRVVLGGTCLENAAHSPEPIYITAKRAAHQVGIAACDETLAVACGHVFHVYGPSEDERRVIPSIVQALLRSENVETTDGAQTRDYLHVADVAAGFCDLAMSSVVGGVDICSGSPVTLRTVFETIDELIVSSGSVRIGALGQTKEYPSPSSGDPATLRGLGWVPAHDLRSGLQSTIEWWRAHGRSA